MPREDAAFPATVSLVRHPGADCPPVQSLQARASLLDSGTLSLGFTLTGALDRLVIPPAANSARTDDLWKHTCFEAFLALEGHERYHEVNLSPSTAWATYAFDRYRAGRVPADALEPRIVVHRKPNRLDLHAVLGLETLEPGQRLRLGLSAVIEQMDGGLSYWAIQHPGPQPDFHRPEAFTLILVPEEE